MANKNPERKLVQIEDGIITGLAGRADIVKEFPFLGLVSRKLNSRPKRPGCGKCSDRSAKGAVYGEVKRAIAGLDSEKKNRLKKLLNTRKIRVLYLNKSRKLVELTF